MTERMSLELADIGSLRARMKQLAAFRANNPSAPSPAGRRTTGLFVLALLSVCCRWYYARFFLFLFQCCLLHAVQHTAGICTDVVFLMLCCCSS